MCIAKKILLVYCFVFKSIFCSNVNCDLIFYIKNELIIYFIERYVLLILINIYVIKKGYLYIYRLWISFLTKYCSYHKNILNCIVLFFEFNYLQYDKKIN